MPVATLVTWLFRCWRRELNFLVSMPDTLTDQYQRHHDHRLHLRYVESLAGETSAAANIHTLGDGKSGDGTNFGIFKQNWYILRNSASQFMGSTVDQVSDGAILK